MSSLGLRLMAFVGVVAALGSSTLTQTEPRTAAIRGVVVDAAGKPIARVRLALMGADVPGAKTVVSDDQGRFAFSSLAAGRFDLVASRTGYVNAAFGERHPYGSGTPIRLAAGQQVNDLRVRLSRGAVVSGTIADETGTAVPSSAGVWTRALVDGEWAERQVASGQTDANGAYRIGGLAPGTYAIRAYRSDTVNVTVAEGEQRTGVNLRLERAQVVPTSAISGTVRLENGRTMQGVNVDVNRSNPPVLPYAPLNLRAPRVDATGHFTVDQVPAGEYVLVAHGADFSVAAPGAQRSFLAYWAETSITVDGHTPTVVTLTLEPGVNITGTLVWKGANPPDVVASRIYVDLVPAGPKWAASRRAPGNHTDQLLGDGRFTMTGVPWGRYSLRVMGPANALDRWTLESAMLGDRDVLDVPFDVTRGQDVSGFVLTMTDRAAVLSGSVHDRAGRATSDPTVIVFPADQRLWPTSTRRICAARPDTSGDFVVPDLPAGEYLVATVPDADIDAWYDPKFLAPLAAGAMRVTLAIGEAKAVVLTSGDLGRFEVIR